MSYKWTKDFKNRDYVEFKNFFKEHNKLFNLNINNDDNLTNISKKMSDLLINEHSFGINQILSTFRSIAKNFSNKTRSDVCIEYYRFRGYDDDYAYIQISERQRRKSKLSIEYWLNKGYDEISAKEQVSILQSKLSKKRTHKILSDENYAKSISAWSINYWIKKGLSKEDAAEKIKEYNPSCRNFYDTSIAYENAKKSISKRVKKLWENGVYDDKVKMINTRYTSKQEKLFFNLLINEKEIDNFIYEPFGINVRSNSDDFYYVYDAYIKTNDGIILVEYDGTYWHDIDKDFKRDDVVLNIRKDIIGVIRINDFYFYKYNQTLKIIINSIQDGIEKIKNKETNRVILYESA
jgi:hypothetical protein